MVKKTFETLKIIPHLGDKRKLTLPALDRAPYAGKQRGLCRWHKIELPQVYQAQGAKEKKKEVGDPV